MSLYSYFGFFQRFDRLLHAVVLSTHALRFVECCVEDDRIEESNIIDSHMKLKSNHGVETSNKLEIHRDMETQSKTFLNKYNWYKGSSTVSVQNQDIYHRDIANNPATSINDDLKDAAHVRWFQMLRSLHIKSQIANDLNILKTGVPIDNAQENSVNGTNISITNIPGIVGSRRQRSEHCSNNIRRRSICPWVYEYATNYTLLPETVQTISCQSGFSRITNSVIHCHQLYDYKLFRVRHCMDNTGSACLVRIRVKSGCVATFPCVVSTVT